MVNGAGSSALDIAKSNHAAFTDAPTWIGSSIGESLKFNGTSNYLTVSHDDSISFDITQGFAFSCWVNPTTIAGGDTFSSTNPRTVIAKYDTDAAYANYQLRLLGGKINFNYRNSSNTSYVGKTTSSEVLSVSVWQHIVAVHTGQDIKIYLNGVEQSGTYGGTVTDSSRTSTQDLAIGKGGVTATSNERFFDGSMQNLRLFKRSIKPSEIVELYVDPWIGSIDFTSSGYFQAPAVGSQSRRNFFFFGVKQ